MISADGAVVDDDIPRPERNGVPLFPSVFSLSSPHFAVLSWSKTNLLNLKLLFITPFGADAVGLLGGHWGVAHLDVGHAWGARDVQRKLEG